MGIDSKYVDCIGDIPAKLKNNNLPFDQSDYTPRTIPEPLTRIYRKALNKLKNEMDEKEFDDRDNFPHNSRVISSIDRKDTIFMYVPPKNCRNIPNGAVDEWYLNSSKTCLLPNMEYGDGKEAEKVKLEKVKKEDTMKKLKNANIGSYSHCKGGLLTFSFIVKSEDTIKCYLYWNGQMTRFMPENIKFIFSNIFNMELKENQEFIKNEKKINKIIKKINKVLKNKFFYQV